MPETLCSECGKPFTPTCPACQRARASQAVPAPEPETEEEEMIVTYEEPISPISPELDDIDNL
jgi:predicted amidophosphoribosyltransferase